MWASSLVKELDSLKVQQYQSKELQNKLVRRPVLTQVSGIVLHGTGNSLPLIETCRFWDRTEADAHWVIRGKDIMSYVPCFNIAYHCGSMRYTRDGYELMGRFPSPNFNTLSIELDESREGIISEDSFDTAVLLIESIRKIWPLAKLYTHHAISGKNCPVNRSSYLEAFHKRGIHEIIDRN